MVARAFKVVARVFWVAAIYHIDKDVSILFLMYGNRMRKSFHVIHFQLFVAVQNIRLILQTCISYIILMYYKHTGL